MCFARLRVLATLPPRWTVTNKRQDPDVDPVERVRRACALMPEYEERLSHGEPTFFVRKKVFAMLSNNHHDDGHVAVMIPAPPGLQATLIESDPDRYYCPPYVGVRGWVGIEIPRIGDDELASHIREAWRLIAPKTLARRLDESHGATDVSERPAARRRTRGSRSEG